MPLIKTLQSKRYKIIVNMLTVLESPKIWIVPRDCWGPVQECYYFPWIVLSLKGETLNYPLGHRFRKYTNLQYYALGPQKNWDFITPLIHKISFWDMGDTKACSEFYQCPLDLLGCGWTCSYSVRLKCLLFQKCSQYVFMLPFQGRLEQHQQDIFVGFT